MRILLCIAAAVLFCISANAKSAQTVSSAVQSAQQYYLKGKEYNSRGQYGKANEEFKKAQDELRKIPAGGTVSLTGLTKDKKRISGAAVNIQNKARSAANADSSSAIKVYLKLVRLDPDNADIHYNLAILYLKTVDYWDASRELMQVVRINPRDEDAWYNLAILYEIFLSNKKLAISSYKKYLKLDPKAKDRGLVKGWIRLLEKKVNER